MGFSEVHSFPAGVGFEDAETAEERAVPGQHLPDLEPQGRCRIRNLTARQR